MLTDQKTDHFRTPPKRYVRLEMSRQIAMQLRDDLIKQIQSGLPGSISVQFRGHLVI